MLPRLVYVLLLSLLALQTFGSYAEAGRQNPVSSLIKKIRALPSKFFRSRNRGVGKGGKVGRSGKTQSANAEGVGPIIYNGGPVVTGSPHVNVYLIYYGNWPKGYGQKIIETFVKSLSSTNGKQGGTGEGSVKNWFAIAGNYYMTNNATNKDTYVGTTARLAGIAYDRFSMGKGPLSPADIATIARWQIGPDKALKYDPKGVYFVLTSNIVEVDGFCSNYCGWHTKAPHYLGSFNLGFVGDHGGCPDPCMPEPASPNCNTAMDATVSTLASQLVNTVTNPDTEGGWMMSDGSEVSDNCAGNYGNETTGELQYARNKDGFQFRYNLVGNNGMKFLISKSWDRIENQCMLQNDLPEEDTPCPNLAAWIRPRMCSVLGRCCG